MGPSLLNNLTYIPYASIHDQLPEFVCQVVEAYDDRDYSNTANIVLTMKNPISKYFSVHSVSLSTRKTDDSKMCTSFTRKSNLRPILQSAGEIWRKRIRKLQLLCL